MPENDEGEPQTLFILPAAGGSYLRNPDGSLTRVEQPTTPAAEATDAEREQE